MASTKSEHVHEFERYELEQWAMRPDGGYRWRTYYVGYQCACGEQGYAVPA